MSISPWTPSLGLTPQSCSRVAAWDAALLAADVSYDEEMLKPVRQETVEQINSALDLHPTSKRQGRRQRGANQPRPLFMSHPDWQDKQTREQLKRVLIAVAKWNGALGYRESFVDFCAMVYGFVGSPRKAFAAIGVVYKFYKLEDYFEVVSRGQESAVPIEEDVMEVWEEVSYLAPEVTQAFRTHGEEASFKSLVTYWLLSLFAVGFSTNPTKFEPLFSRIIGADHASWDHSRTLLKHIAACFLMRNKNLLAASDSPEALRAEVLKMRLDLEVDDALLHLIDLGRSSRRCQAWEIASMLPAASLSGWLFGSACASAVLPGAALALGTLGACTGGALAVSWGVETGRNSFQKIMHVASESSEDEPPAR